MCALHPTFMRLEFASCHRATINQCLPNVNHEQINRYFRNVSGMIIHSGYWIEFDSSSMSLDLIYCRIRTYYAHARGKSQRQLSMTKTTALTWQPSTGTSTKTFKRCTLQFTCITGTHRDKIQSAADN